MLNDFKRVQVLSEVLPYLQRFAGCIIVVKYGGSAMQNQTLKDKVINDILCLSCMGIRPILVHGGGPMIDDWLNKVNIKSKFEKGVRLTDSKTMEIVEMVLVGKVNQDLVALINKKKGKAIGLSGKDAKLIIASGISESNQNLVGKVSCVNPNIIKLLIHQGYIPVVASVAADLNGRTYNINADTVAGAIAKELKAEKLVLLTDAPGIMYDTSDEKTLFKYLNKQQVNILKEQQVISGGMIPKVDSCIQALSGGVHSAHIIDGRIDHALLLEVLTRGGIGSVLI
uniref:Acetylglutamate kinase n=1 Tax=Rhodogorgon sp. TaxID=2485824 RepID=A0A3G3MHV2_9FLOR|nr:acetylglutamate kinase [Rhodogorgon sp.]